MTVLLIHVRMVNAQTVWTRIHVHVMQDMKGQIVKRVVWFNYDFTTPFSGERGAHARPKQTSKKVFF